MERFQLVKAITPKRGTQTTNPGKISFASPFDNKNNGCNPINATSAMSSGSVRFLSHFDGFGGRKFIGGIWEKEASSNASYISHPNGAEQSPTLWFMIEHMKAAVFFCLILVALVVPKTVVAQSTSTPTQLTVGITAHPPFVIKKPNGEYSGFSIELWEKIAVDNQLKFIYREFSDVRHSLSRHQADRSTSPCPTLP